MSGTDWAFRLQALREAREKVRRHESGAQAMSDDDFGPYSVDDVWQAGYQRGHTCALEEAAKIADAKLSDSDGYVRFAAQEIANAIRALAALSEPKKRTEPLPTWQEMRGILKECKP